MKRILLPLFIMLLPLIARAYDVFIDGIYYNLDKNAKTANVTYENLPGLDDKHSYSGSVTIPSSINYLNENYSVTSIGGSAFTSCTGLTSIDIPNSVVSIGFSAFEGCTGLQSIIIPNSVTIIGDEAFYGCTGLQSINIPNSVMGIGRKVFYGCIGLTSIIFPNSITAIGESAFYGCTGLTSIIFPNSITAIGESAFYGCTGLTSIVIPNSIMSVASSTFAGCSGLVSIKVAEDNTVYDSRDNCNAIIETATNTLIAGCKNTTIPNSVVSIGFGAFNGCTGLQSVNIPNNVTNISAYAFVGCSGLSSIKVAENNTVYDSRDNCNAIIETATNTMIVGCKNTTIPNSVVSIGSGAFNGCTGLQSVNIPNNVTNISAYAFAGCSGLSSIKVAENNTVYDSRDNCNAIIETATNTLIVGCKNTTIPNSVTSMGDGAFYRQETMTSIEIPNSITSIGSYAFAGCIGLTSIKIPNSVTIIMQNAFSDCYDLNSIAIPNSVTTIGYDAFTNCPNLTSVTLNCNSIVSTASSYSQGFALAGIFGYQVRNYILGNSITRIDDAAFHGCVYLTSIEIPSSVSDIGRNVFSGCYSLSSIKVAEDNTVYDSRDNCNAIIETATNTLIAGCKNTVIPNSVTCIGAAAFYRQEAMTSIEIPNSITSIGSSAFAGCIGLTSIKIPNSVITLGVQSFAGCSGVTSVIIGSGLTSVGDDTFNYCTKLTSVCCFADTPPSSDGYAFHGIPGSATLYVPAQSLEAYKKNYYWGRFANILPIDVTEIQRVDSTNEGKKIEHIFTLDGKLQNGFQKGINVVKYSDGSTSKLMMK